MSTTKLYQQDVYIKSWEAKVKKITEKGIYLDRTAFFPEGGGQSCDLGRVSKGGTAFAVTDVQEDGDDVVHVLSSECDRGNCNKGIPETALEEGDILQCELNWERRFDNMQRHCGEHILSGIFYRECGGVNRGFHMGDEYMTIDISLEDEPANPDRNKPDEITWETARHCELLANRVIWENAPVHVFRFNTREEAEKLPLRKKLAFDENISIVCVGSPENAADCVACCGTHPETAGQVGLIKIFKVENYKGMFRIYCEAGQRALRDYDMKHDMLTELSGSRSCSIEDLPDKVRGTESRLAEAKGQLAQLKKVLLEEECRKLDLELSDSGAPVHLYRLDNFSMDDAFSMAKSYMGRERCMGRLILLYSAADTSFILVSEGSPECGRLVREYAGFYQGKGGGNDVSARAIFTSEENAMLFADLISKHLQ